MNRIVREHYPVEKLPEDLRRELDAGRTVRVTIETEPGLRSPELAALKAKRRSTFKSVAEVNDYVRSLRDGDDR